MKKYAKIAYIALIIFVIMVAFFVYYKVSSKNDTEKEIKNKTLSELRMIENNFLELFNLLNNITFDNYKISYNEIQDENVQNGTSTSSKENSESNKQENASNTTVEESDKTSKDKQYEIEETGILTRDTNIDWNEIKSQVEVLYTPIYNTTLDLYKITINQDEVINFNKEYDNLTSAVKSENKEKTLDELSILYDYLPRFIDYCTDEEKQKIVIRTKNDIFKAYSILDREDWNIISQNIANSASELTKLVTSADNQNRGKQYNINKAYILVNELQNAVNLKDKDIFLIKYKNLLEELQNI